MLFNARCVNQRPGIGLLLIGKLIMISIICYYSKMRPFRSTPGPLDLLDDMALALPDEGTGLLGIGVARITLDN